MIKDSDRIFTNLYGTQDWRLTAAKKRGGWGNKILKTGKEVKSGSAIGRQGSAPLKDKKI